MTAEAATAVATRNAASTHQVLRSVGRSVTRWRGSVAVLAMSRHCPGRGTRSPPDRAPFSCLATGSLYFLGLPEGSTPP